MQIRQRTAFGSPRKEKVLADSSYTGMTVSSDPTCIGGVYLNVNGQGSTNGKIFLVRLSPDEIEALWALYQEKGAGTQKGKR